MKDKLKYCFLLYYVFGVFGSVVELLWYYYINNYLHNPDQFPAFFTLTPVRACYGFGAVFIYIIVPNILKRYQGRFRIVLNYFLSLIIGVVIEIIAAFVLVLKFGYNPLWNYSKQPFNFMGYICLENSVIFGFIGIFFIYIAFPLIDKLILKIGKVKYSQFVVFAFVTYCLDLLFLIIRIALNMQLNVVI